MIKKTCIGVLTVIGIVLGLLAFPKLQQALHSVAPNDQQLSQKAACDSADGKKLGLSAGHMQNSSAKPKVENTSTLSPAKRLAAFLASETDINVKGKFVRDLIQELCAAGKTDEAYNLIDKNFGQLRDDGLFAFFHHAKLDDNQLLDLMKKENGTDLIPVVAGFFNRYNREQLVAILENEKFKTLSTYIQKETPKSNLPALIADAFASLAKGAAKEDILKNYNIMLDLVEKGTILPWNVYELLKHNKDLSPFEKWDLVKQLETSNHLFYYYNEQAPLMRRMQIDSIIRSDAVRAMGQILNNQHPNQAVDIENAISSWSQIDAVGISQWYQNNQSKIPQPQRNMIANGFVNQATISREFNSATYWASQISDPTMRQQAIQKIQSDQAFYQKLDTAKP